MEIDVQPNWANDPRAYGLADGLAEWADDPRAYGLGSPNLELGFPDDLLDPHDLVQLDGPSNSTTGTAPEQPNNHSEDVSENPADLPVTQPAIDVKPEEHLPVPSGSSTDRQNNEESSNRPPPSQPFPLSPPTVPVVLDCFDIPSPAPSSDDEDLPDAAQLLSQLFRPKRNSKETVKDEPSKDEDDDIQILDGDPTVCVFLSDFVTVLIGFFCVVLRSKVREISWEAASRSATFCFSWSWADHAIKSETKIRGIRVSLSTIPEPETQAAHQKLSSTGEEG